jgi:protein-L-isoaspartate(D-aspartate) O-methyltransferase
MKTLRPLLVGIVLAALWIIAYTTWQLTRVRGGAPTKEASPGPSQDTPTQDKHVWKTVEADSAGDAYAEQRRQMVTQQLEARDITDKRVLETMRKVPRHLFVLDKMIARAYQDMPLPIDHEQSISQPYIVALMTQLAQPTEAAIALDVGTGSGYQAAVLSPLCKHVYSIEIIEGLANTARERLQRLGYKNVTVRAGDGYGGWPEHAPFDLIIVAAAPEQVPPPLIDQLKPGGRLVIPVGRYYQSLIVVHKEQDGSVRRQQVIPVAFVPMTGQAQKQTR